MGVEMQVIRAGVKGLGLALCLAMLPLPAASVAEDLPLPRKLELALATLGPHALSAARVVTLPERKVLYERNADLSMNPASNMKLFTSAAAMAKLGPEYRYTTRVVAAGKPSSEGVVEGDLILVGGGDPVLETRDLEKLADAVKATGAREIAGGLVADDHRYDDERLGIGWNSDDEPFYYSAQITALTVNRNVLLVDVEPGMAVGDLAGVKVGPAPEYISVENRVRTVAADGGTLVRITRRRARNEVVISGRIALGSAAVRGREVTMEEPQLYAAQIFRNLLAARGIQVKGANRHARSPLAGVELASHQSIPLSEILPLLNKPSDNLIAEMLLKEIGFAVRKSGDATAGSEVLEAWLKEIGIDNGGVRINDGSGLSRLDLVTSRAVSDLLLWVDQQPWRETFIRSLPVAGVDGTLRSRLRGTAAEKNLMAKTGSLSHVTALGGYVTGRGGQRYVVSILINNYPGSLNGAAGAKRAEDAIAIALAESPPEQ